MPSSLRLGLQQENLHILDQKKYHQPTQVLFGGNRPTALQLGLRLINQQ